MTLNSGAGTRGRGWALPLILHATSWNISRAAARLGLARNTFRYRMRRHRDAIAGRVGVAVAGDGQQDRLAEVAGVLVGKTARLGATDQAHEPDHQPQDRHGVHGRKRWHEPGRRPASPPPPRARSGPSRWPSAAGRRERPGVTRSPKVCRNRALFSGRKHGGNNQRLRPACSALESVRRPP